MQTATIQLETLVCPSCTQKIEKATKALDGIDKDSVDVYKRQAISVQIPRC